MKYHTHRFWLLKRKKPTKTKINKYGMKWIKITWKYCNQTQAHTHSLTHTHTHPLVIISTIVWDKQFDLIYSHIIFYISINSVNKIDFHARIRTLTSWFSLFLRSIKSIETWHTHTHTHMHIPRSTTNGSWKQRKNSRMNE